jgi:HAE1 family hydrophobic/amphiphilic exporter-1
MRDLLERAARRLPDDADEPILLKFNTANMPILFFGITARENREKMDDVDQRRDRGRAQARAGVSVRSRPSAVSSGRSTSISTPTKLSAYGLSLDQGGGGDRPATTVPSPPATSRSATVDYTIRVPASSPAPAEVGDVVVKRSGDTLVRLSDVAVVEDGFVERDGVVETNDKWAMMMMVQKRSGENTVAVCRRVLKRMDEIKPATFPPTTRSSHQRRQRHDRQVDRSVEFETVLYGGLFVILTTLFFLRKPPHLARSSPSPFPPR